MSQRKVAIIFGATGQIGSYLSELLLSKPEYNFIIGVTRRTSNSSTERLNLILNNERFYLRTADITDPFSLFKLFNSFINDTNVIYEIYNLAAMSFVKESFNEPMLSADVTGIGHVNILETLLPFHQSYQKHNIRLYYMNSSETFGLKQNKVGFQDICTPFFPQSPYGAAKLYAYHMNRIYRESYGMFTTAGIIFNTESPRRGSEFVTRKITQWFAKFMADDFILTERLKLGNIKSQRDWTHAKDTCNAIYLIATNKTPKDYCVSSGETHTVLDFIKECYHNAKFISGQTCNIPVDELYEIKSEYFRPNEVPYLKGDSTPIREELGWKPTISFVELVYEMLMCDYVKELKMRGKRFATHNGAIDILETIK